jgi:outer membrane protein TolC
MLICLGVAAGVPASVGAQPAAHRTDGTFTPFTPPTLPTTEDRPLPIDLPTALQLAGVQPIDVALATERVRLASAQLSRARAAWLPTIYVGVDYYRHDGEIQDVAGNVFPTGKGNFTAGAGPSAVIATSDALFGPLAARQTVRAREASLQAALNDTLLAVAEAYFNVQQARGELAGAEDAAKRANELITRAEKFSAPAGLVPPVEVTRVRVEAARRREAVRLARERWKTASAELSRLLRLDAAAVVMPQEPPHLLVSLVRPEVPVDELIQVGLTNRPELASDQAFVEATLARLRQEKLRPLTPSIVLRGATTNPAGNLGSGVFGGGHDGAAWNWGGRNDLDLQIVLEFQNLGLGNKARVRERRSENQLAVLELFRTQDRVAAEVAQAHAQLSSAVGRLADAEAAVKDAVDLAEKNAAALGQTTEVRGTQVLIVRPQEVVAALQALAQAYADYYGAVGDYDRAQFRLYRALGHPAQSLACQPPAVQAPAVPPWANP